jgi:hypothetical protein
MANSPYKGWRTEDVRLAPFAGPGKEPLNRIVTASSQDCGIVDLMGGATAGGEGNG